jgi:hypothetical protein
MDPQTVEEWCSLALQKQRAAALLLANGQFEEAWVNAGFAVECALKAAIFAKERFNSWPSRDARPDLYIHDISRLMSIAQLDLVALVDEPIAAKFMTVRLWRRSDGYKTRRPGNVARDICDAAFSPDGVLKWIGSRFQIPL